MIGARVSSLGTLVDIDTNFDGRLPILPFRWLRIKSDLPDILPNILATRVNIIGLRGVSNKYLRSYG